MKPKWIFVVLVVLFVAIFLVRRWNTGYDFQETALNGQTQVLNDLAARTTLKVNTTSQDGLLGVVGLVLVVDRQNNSGPVVLNGQSAIPKFRPSGEAILVSPMSKTLYEGKISKALNAGGSYTSMTASLNNDQTAEILIVDEMYLGYRDRSKIPYAELAKLKPPPGKAYYFVEGATLTSTTYRTFDEVTTDGALEGSAFKANGKVFTSNKGFAYTSHLSVDIFDVQLLQPAEAGDSGRRDILVLFQQHVDKPLDAEEAEKLSGLLKIETKDMAYLKGSELNVFVE